MSTMTNDDNDGEADYDDDKDNEYVLSLCENAFTENERLNGAWEACLKTLKMLTICNENPLFLWIATHIPHQALPLVF